MGISFAQEAWVRSPLTYAMRAPMCQARFSCHATKGCHMSQYLAVPLTMCFCLALLATGIPQPRCLRTMARGWTHPCGPRTRNRGVRNRAVMRPHAKPTAELLSEFVTRM
jgi:hypothetical protein